MGQQTPSSRRQNKNGGDLEQRDRKWYQKSNLKTRKTQNRDPPLVRKHHPKSRRRRVKQIQSPSHRPWIQTRRDPISSWNVLNQKHRTRQRNVNNRDQEQRRNKRSRIGNRSLEIKRGNFPEKQQGVYRPERETHLGNQNEGNHVLETRRGNQQPQQPDRTQKGVQQTTDQQGYRRADVREEKVRIRQIAANDQVNLPIYSD